ncbi:MAG: phage holin family protein [Paracoccaceae bacterium]
MTANPDPALREPVVGARVDAADPRSTTGLMSDAMTHVSSLVRNEVDLARAEVQENVSRAGTAIGLLAGAMVVALVALNVLAAALVDAIAALGLTVGWAALIVGAVFGIIAAIMVSKGLNDLKLSSLAPTRTQKNLKRDATAVKETLND